MYWTLAEEDQLDDRSERPTVSMISTGIHLWWKERVEM